jgi:DNA-binding XRE family transcriptional regulator
MHNSKITTSKINLKTTSIDKIIKESSKSSEFKNTFNEELHRIRIARQIKKLRNQLKLTQEKFALKIDMPQSVIARAESGKHTISLSTLSRVAHAFGKEVTIA